MFDWDESYTVLVDAPAEEVFKALTDLPRWSEWVDEIEACETDGPAKTGTKGVMKLNDGAKQPFSVGKLEHPSTLRNDFSFPLWTRGHDEFTVTPEGEQTPIEVRVHCSGLLAPRVKRENRPIMVERFPMYLKRLGKRARLKAVPSDTVGR